MNMLLLSIIKKLAEPGYCVLQLRSALFAGQEQEQSGPRTGDGQIECLGRQWQGQECRGAAVGVAGDCCEILIPE